MDYDMEASQFPDMPRFNFNGILQPKAVRSFANVKKKTFSLNGKSKGLRDLSYKVKKIIECESQTTYRFVADKLVQADSEQKVEQNVKRRVYDALNVLIAVGVIIKKNKFLVATDETFKSGKCHNKEKWQKIKEDQQQRAKKRQVIVQKKQFLNNLVQRMASIKQLITRNNNNKSLPNSQNAADIYLNDNVVLQFSQQSVQQSTLPPTIYLPLIVFWAKPEDV